MQLHRDIEKFKVKNVRVVVVCPEKIDVVENFSDTNNISFDMVSDDKHVLARRYGQKVNYFKLGRMPAQLIMDSNAKFVFQHFANSMGDIIDNFDILDTFDELKRQRIEKEKEAEKKAESEIEASDETTENAEIEEAEKYE